MTVTEGMRQYAQADAEQQDAARKAATYNALARVYGPGAGAVEEQAADLASKAATTANTQAEADTRNALVPGVAAAQAATTGETNARTRLAGTQADAAALEVQRAQLQQHALIAHAALKPDGSNAEDVWNSVAPDVRATLRADDATMGKLHDAFVADPHGELNQIIGNKPTEVNAVDVNGNPAFGNRDPLSGAIAPAPAGGLQPFSPTEGAPTRLQNPDGTYSLMWRRQSGGTAEIKLPKGVIPTSDYEAGVRAGLQQERITGEKLPGATGVASSAPLVEGTGDPKAIPPQSRYARLATQKDKDTANNFARQAINVADGVAQAKPILQQVLEQITPYTTGPGVLINKLPASIQNNLRRNLETLKANEFLSVLGGMKNQSGQSGIGRVLQSEVPMMQSAFGNMQQDQDTKQLAQHVSLLAQFLDRSSDKAVGGFKAAYGADPYDVSGVKPYSPRMTTPATGAAAELPTPAEARVEQARRKAAQGK